MATPTAPVPQAKLLSYDASLTARLFHASNAKFRFMLGPVGCGKSVACVMEIIMRAMKQEPHEGVRKSRWCILRNSYPELKSTTIKTFQEWCPDSVCPLVFDVPIRGTIKQNLKDGTRLELEVLFLALDQEQDIKKLLSLELTGAWINEVREIPKEIFEVLRGRINRYPRVQENADGTKAEGSGATYSGIVCDTNPPKVGTWIHELFESSDGVPEGFAVFKYPPAVYYDGRQHKWTINPDAENLRWLSSSYYQDQIAGNSEAYVRVMLAGEYGITMQGKPVYPQFSQRVHVAKEILRGDRSLPLITMWDFGLNPAMICGQLSRRGKFCLLDELAPADEDLESFCSDYVMPLLNEKYAGFALTCVGDPAARGRSGLDKRTAFDVLGKFGLRLQLAPTNAFAPRKEAVDYFLNRNEGLLVSPHCVYLIEGFVGGYVYEKAKNTIAGDSRHKDKPEKNKYSHGQDAVQYGALYVMKGSGVQRAGRMLNGMGNDTKKSKPFLWV